MPEPIYELLDVGVCTALLEYSHVGRVAATIGALPAIVPVTYLVDGESVVFRPVTGNPVGGPGVVVAFEAGHIDPTGQGGWSVHVVGVAEEIGDVGTRVRLGLAPKRPWSLGEKEQLYRLPLEMMSGTRIVVPPGSATS